MVKSVKKVLSNTWVVSILCSIIATIIISIATSLYKQINLLEALKLLFETLLTLTSNVVTFRVPVYIIFLVIIFSIMVIKIYIKIQDTKTSNLPKWLNYTKAKYKKWVLKWEYRLRYDNKYEVENLRPICECGCELSQASRSDIIYHGNDSFVCPKCGETYPPLERNTLQDYLKILYHDIDIGNYPQDL